MVTAQPGVVVLVRFPFSDLSSSKLRPAVVPAHAGGVDWILCQVTSNPYGDSTAVPLMRVPRDSRRDGGGASGVSNQGGIAAGCRCPRCQSVLVQTRWLSAPWHPNRDVVFPRLREECRRTEAAICRLTGQRDILDEAPWLLRSIRVRNPYVDPMNYVQLALLRRLRENPGEAEAEEMRDAVRLSVNGIAAGLRNTG